MKDVKNNILEGTKDPELNKKNHRRIKPLDSKVHDIRMARNIIRWYNMTKNPNCEEE